MRARLVCGRTCIAIVVAFVALLDWNCTEDKIVLELACPPRNNVISRSIVGPLSRLPGLREQDAFRAKAVERQSAHQCQLAPTRRVRHWSGGLRDDDCGKRDGEFVADFTAEGRRLGKPKMMRVRRLSSAYQARMFENVFAWRFTSPQGKVANWCLEILVVESRES